MSTLHADLVIIGSGFGGALAAILARRRDLNVVLIDRASHPRFAIGESSTPIANLMLERIADANNLPWLRPFAKYATWKRAYPAIPCGPKRGFTYVHHETGRPFIPRDDHANELLVGSNPDIDRADCQWLRADFDAFIFQNACQIGVTCLEDAVITTIERDEGTPRRPWQLTVNAEGRPLRLTAGFLIDAAGGSLVAHALGIPDAIANIWTRSRTLYAHFHNVDRWHNADTPRAHADHPFPIDDATLHHVFDGGWMWIIRFDNEFTSAGFCLDPEKWPQYERLSPELEWRTMIDRFPSIREQFADARAITPFTRTARIQRCTSQAAGRDWAMLPATAGFIDPFFSTGNAHTLIGVSRLIDIIAHDLPGKCRSRRLADYDRTIRSETQAIDRLVHACYNCFYHMSCLCPCAMLYFLAATVTEDRIRHGATDIDFLLAHDDAFQSIVREVQNRAHSRSPIPLAELRDRTSDYNLAGLCDEERKNMYPFSAPV